GVDARREHAMAIPRGLDEVICPVGRLGIDDGCEGELPRETEDVVSLTVLALLLPRSCHRRNHHHQTFNFERASRRPIVRGLYEQAARPTAPPCLGLSHGARFRRSGRDGRTRPSRRPRTPPARQGRAAGWWRWRWLAAHDVPRWHRAHVEQDAGD